MRFRLTGITAIVAAIASVSLGGFLSGPAAAADSSTAAPPPAQPTLVAPVPAGVAPASTDANAGTLFNGGAPCAPGEAAWALVVVGYGSMTAVSFGINNLGEEVFSPPGYYDCTAQFCSVGWAFPPWDGAYEGAAFSSQSSTLQVLDSGCGTGP